MRTIISILCIMTHLVPIIVSAQVPGVRVPLNGQWAFRSDPEEIGLSHHWFADSTDRSGWSTVEVPAFWETYPGLGTYDGWGWFARMMFVEFTTQPLSVYFGGVDDEAVVWVNGIEVGSHTGYSEPFAVDGVNALRPGENTVVVLVKDHGGGGGIYKPVTLTTTADLDELLKSPYYGLQAIRSADWVRDAVIYCVYLRSFSPEGTFAGLERRLPELKDMGVTVLWLMPIHPVGEKHRKGKLGSPYAVRDYYAINPEFGTMQDFKHLLNAVHRQRMRLIIDPVANHTAWDSKLMEQHPEWFTHDSTGAIVSPNPDWTDVADLDYSHLGLRGYMIEMMRWWVKDVGIDGFRCDVAELVPTDFWEEARERLNRIKPVLMLSEGSIPEHHVKAFDITYSWTIYDVLGPLLKGELPLSTLDNIFRMERLQYPSGAIRLRFNTNHDKNMRDAPAALRYGPEGLKLTAAFVSTIPGVPLIYTGEEVGNTRKLSLFEKVSVDWSRPRTMETLYKTLFRLRGEHKALSRGDMVRVPSANSTRVYAFFRVAGVDKILAVFNFAPEKCTDTLMIPMDRLFPGQKASVMKDAFSGKRIELEEHLVLPMEGRGYRVFVVEQ
jgi:glycosidase